MAELTVQALDEDGITPSYDNAAAGGDEFAYDEHAFIHVKNGDASEHTVTIPSQYTASEVKPGLQTQDLAVAVPAGEERMIGPFYEPAYKDSNGMVQITYDAVTSVTVGVFRL